MVLPAHLLAIHDIELALERLQHAASVEVVANLHLIGQDILYGRVDDLKCQRQRAAIVTYECDEHGAYPTIRTPCLVTRGARAAFKYVMMVDTTVLVGSEERSSVTLCFFAMSRHWGWGVILRVISSAGNL